jgi:starch-binding outer membrane protein, SusD/RagB family
MKTNAQYKIMCAVCLSIISLLLGACEDFLDVGTPKTEITSQAVFSNDASAAAAIRGIYSLMMSNSGFAKGELERFTGILSDELITYSSNNEHQQFGQPALQPTNSIVLRTFWTEAYKYINNANFILEGLSKSNGLTSKLKDQIEGEALFVRAYCHFYLVNLFGHVPYVTTTDYNVNASIQQVEVTEAYEKIIEDLLKSRSLMVEGFSYSNNERTQPNKGAATALLARVYLYQSDWPNAEALADELIGNSALYKLVDLDKVFLPNSNESIWQLKPVVPGSNTPQGQLFILKNTPANTFGAVSLSGSFVASFDSDDARRASWIGTYSNGSTFYFPFKYKYSNEDVLREYSMVFRLAEQYLIRAEARARQNKLTDGTNDINAIRNRAGLSNVSPTTNDELLQSIELERKFELFTEGGHRWLDLKRTQRASAVLAPIKQDWQANDQLFPIPQAERSINPALSQNPGY